MAALCIFGHHNISVTDVECQWNKQNAPDEVVTIDELYPTKSHRSTSRNLNQDEVEEFREKLDKFGTIVGFSWLLCPEPDNIIFDDIPDVEKIIFSEEYFNSANKQDFLKSKMSLNTEQILKLAEITTGQSKNEKWLTYRKNRLTASNFGVVLAACRRKSYPISLFQRLSNFYNLENVKAIQWGNLHENVAISVFQTATNLKVMKTGLWLDCCGFLGASPDGLISDDAIIEVKCPFKFRNSDLEEKLKNNRSYIIYMENGNINVNYMHEYYSQIQFILAITKRNLCHLVIWTPSKFICKKIPRDSDWAKNNMPILQTFYIDHYLQFLSTENIL